MADRPLTFTERESRLQAISSRLASLMEKLEEDDGDDIARAVSDFKDEAGPVLSALDYTVRWDGGHGDLPPLDMSRPIIAPLPVVWADQYPAVLYQRVLAIAHPNEDGKDIGWVGVTTAQTVDYILLHWNGVRGMVYGRDILRAWLSTFSPAEAGGIPYSPASEDPAQ